MKITVCNTIIYYRKKGVNQMSSIEKIIEGMKLIKEGCSEIPAEDYNCDKSPALLVGFAIEKQLTPQKIGASLPSTNK